MRDFDKYITKTEIENYLYKSLSIINPLLSENYNQNKILSKISKFDGKSKDTGLHSSNCKINDLGIQIHLKKYGFHPYSAELASQIRTKQIKRLEAIEKITTNFVSENLKSIAKKFNYNIEI